MRVLLALFFISSASAQELPKNLLLNCEGKLTVLGLERAPLEQKFEVMLRLKDGELVDTNSRWLTTRKCQLKGGVVRCSWKEVVASQPPLTGSERRELFAAIVKDTGEYNHFLETWSYEGKNASGKQTGNMKWHRQGICHPVSKPIF